jgi:hypothetical protein
MERQPRTFPPHSLVEVTMVTIQNRFLLRPSPEVNDLVVGVFGRAQRQLDLPIVCLTVMSSHLHLLVIPRDPEHLADFMEFVNCNLSKEIGTRIRGWRGTMWSSRYHHAVVSPKEEEVQVARLVYCLANGVKEGLVDRPSDWPGVQSATALMEGKDLVGHWYDRTREHAARQRRGEVVDSEHLATEERIVFTPLPCWQHLPEEDRRSRVAELVEKIEEDGARERRLTGARSLGAAKILRADPLSSPARIVRSPQPRFHASRKVMKEMREALSRVIAAFREASARLRAGERDVEFPEGTFPPALPFVPFAGRLSVEARGQPA